MPAIVSDSEIERCLRGLLKEEGFSLSLKRAHGQTGVDLLASKKGEVYHIEIIAYKRAGSARAKDFFEAFFRVVSRLDDGAKHCVLALSRRTEIGLPARANQHRVAWRRIRKTFPELEIWLVDTEKCTYRRTTWGQWLD
jgi:hypothetical protein